MSLRDKIFELKYLGREVVLYGRTYKVVAYSLNARTFDLVDEDGMRSECNADLLMNKGEFITE